MIVQVISGGQTGADQGGLRAARACGIPTSGWAPKGWMTEAGPAPWLADWGLAGDLELDRLGDRQRTAGWGSDTGPGDRDEDAARTRDY
jgi:hypothetical protein